MSVNPIITGGSPLVTTVSRLKWNISNPQNTRKMLKPVIYFQVQKFHSKKSQIKILRFLAIKNDEFFYYEIFYYEKTHKLSSNIGYLNQKLC